MGFTDNIRQFLSGVFGDSSNRPARDPLTRRDHFYRFGEMTQAFNDKVDELRSDSLLEKGFLAHMTPYESQQLGAMKKELAELRAQDDGTHADSMHEDWESLRRNTAGTAMDIANINAHILNRACGNAVWEDAWRNPELRQEVLHSIEILREEAKAALSSPFPRVYFMWDTGTNNTPEKATKPVSSRDPAKTIL
jgi:hypothetical protein